MFTDAFSMFARFSISWNLFGFTFIRCHDVFRDSNYSDMNIIVHVKLSACFTYGTCVSFGIVSDPSGISRAPNTLSNVGI
jgi:hypothetical protein